MAMNRDGISHMNNHAMYYVFYVYLPNKFAENPRPRRKRHEPGCHGPRWYTHCHALMYYITYAVHIQSPGQVDRQNFENHLYASAQIDASCCHSLLSQTGHSSLDSTWHWKTTSFNHKHHSHKLLKQRRNQDRENAHGLPKQQVLCQRNYMFKNHVYVLCFKLFKYEE